MKSPLRNLRCEAEVTYLVQEPTQFVADLSEGFFIAMTSEHASHVGICFSTKLKNAQSLLVGLQADFLRQTKVEVKDVKVKVLAVSKEIFVFPKTKITPENRTLVQKNVTSEKREILYFHPEARMRISVTEEKTRVLIVDDSKTVCALLEKIFSSSPDLEVVGTIQNPNLVAEAILKLNPQVLTFDIHMPEKDGVHLLKEILPRFGLPVVMISALSMEDGNQVLEALEAGAVDYIQKPAFDQLHIATPMMIEKIKVAAKVKPNLAKTKAVRKVVPSFQISPDSVVILGASTGGTEAIREVLKDLPNEIPPILIVQHIPAVFSKAFSDRLNLMFPFEVKEAEDGDVVMKNRVLIGPGGFQMRVEKKNQHWVVRVTSEPPVNRHCPSVDVLFESAAQRLGKNAIGVILTGMGADGAKGLLSMRKAGAHTIAQDEASCVVFGMPRQAIELGAAERIEPLEHIAETMMKYARLPDLKKAN